MNLSDLPIRLISPNSHTAIVSPWDFAMEVTFEHDPGESPILWPTEMAHPGSPAMASILSCKVGGVEILEMLSPRQLDRIESAVLDQLEG